ncbi:MAG: hypothetical protein K2I88_06885 [Anaeroplasmataceae bacterium]|nr:hypothetical protein [Anaeroplasmataceae bacterium]
MFKKIINWIRNLKFSKDKDGIKEINLENVQSMKFGDEFWADIKEYNGQEFPEGHRKRPFVFIELKGEKIYCLYASSKSGRYSIPITRGKYAHFVYYNKLYKIDVKCFMNRKKDSLSEKELTEIVRNGFTRLPLNKYLSEYKKYASVRVGDIVWYNNANYYLFAMDSVLATIYPIRNTFSEWFVPTSNKKYIAIFSPMQVKKEALTLIRPENPKLVQVIKDNKYKAKRMKKCNIIAKAYQH